jgi:hypothetical protein
MRRYEPDDCHASGWGAISASHGECLKTGSLSTPTNSKRDGLTTVGATGARARAPSGGVSPTPAHATASRKRYLMLQES